MVCVIPYCSLRHRPGCGNLQACGLTTRSSGRVIIVGRVLPRHGHCGRSLNSVVRKQMNRLRLTAGILVAMCALAACDRGSEVPGGTSIRIAHISPGTSTSLRVGESVTVRAEVEYALPAESGTITLVIQSSDNRTISNETEVVAKGSGKIVLSSTFVVPDTKAIQVFTPLSAQGQVSTTTVDQRAYKVEPK